jgi:DNA-binding response OmpR family regulator
MQKILIIDNDELLLERLMNLFEKNNYITAGLNHGEANIKTVELFNPAIILIDIFQIIDGKRLPLKLKSNERTQAIKIILHSHYHLRKEDYDHFGCDDFIAKSVNEETLLVKIRMLLNH